MISLKHFSTMLLGSAIVATLATASVAAEFDIPEGDLKTALAAYTAQSGVELIVSSEAIRETRTGGAKGALSPNAALTHILAGTGFIAHRTSSGAVGIVRDRSSSIQPVADLSIQIAQATPARAAVETVTVTSSKLGGADVQSIPIAITALSQEQLTATQTAGGPDLVKQVPNLTFTKTNFTGYSIQIRGIGTQAISVTTDPAVAVAMNDIPFIRNHFFEQEFYDVGQVEVLRGPQGTLYGRNATAGVVNLTTAKPTDQFEAMASGELGNYHQRRFEGMINIPVTDDRLDIRLAGEWTKRQGYSFNTLTDERIDGRDLWSGRLSIGFKPFQNLQTTLVWEHFSEDDDRLRTSKQLCHTDTPPLTVGGAPVAEGSLGLVSGGFTLGADYLSQGCKAASLYSSDSFEVPYGFSLPYAVGGAVAGVLRDNVNPYASATQSSNLRVIESSLNPTYKAKNDIVELNTDYAMTPELTFTSQTGFNHDFLASTEDYNRFNTSPGLFLPNITSGFDHLTDENGVFCDPQLGCSSRLVAEDMSDEHAWQLSQEFRLASNFSGPFNFSLGGNYLHYETEEDYFVFINTITALSYSTTSTTAPGPEGHNQCLVYNGGDYDATGYQHPDPRQGAGQPTHSCVYIDFNPITSLDKQGHNYFLSQNPYTLNSYAAFGEAYYNVLPDLKLITGLRFTEDRKHFVDFPSELDAQGYGYTAVGTVDQQWDQFTGRAAANWTPKLSFTDQTLVYASYAHGYKAGGANPPGAVLYSYSAGVTGVPSHPLTFKPEYVDAFELGSKNTLLDGALTVNTSAFYYNYEAYQISEIVDRTSINLNFNAHVKGAEIESTWEPVPGLRFNFAGGWEDARLANGDKAIDLIDRTAGHSGWVVMKPFVTQSSNCIFPDYVVATLINIYANNGEGNAAVSACGFAYNNGIDPVAGGGSSYLDQAVAQGYPGYDPVSPTATNNGYGPAPNNGAGFDKDLGGNELPNAPPFTVSAGAQYTMPLSADWAGTLRGDFYWQDNSWARVFNDDPYDRLHGYKNFNLTVILTSQAGWQVMLYDKNVFNTTAITGTFLNSDDSGLTTNVFLTDPKLIGIRVTKNW